MYELNLTDHHSVQIAREILADADERRGHYENPAYAAEAVRMALRLVLMAIDEQAARS